MRFGHALETVNRLKTGNLVGRIVLPKRVERHAECVGLMAAKLKVASIYVVDAEKI